MSRTDFRDEIKAGIDGVLGPGFNEEREIIATGFADGIYPRVNTVRVDLTALTLVVEDLLARVEELEDRVTVLETPSGG